MSESGFPESNTMPESAQQSDAHATLPGPGSYLAAQRQAYGWSVEQIADQLKLAPRQVLALEADDYASLPGTAVTRGFVRAYAKALKMDAAELIGMLPTDIGSASMPARRELSTPFAQTRMPFFRSSRQLVEMDRGCRSTWGVAGGRHRRSTHGLAAGIAEIDIVQSEQGAGTSDRC
ncbi:helix-turn-helix domain-containing protein [Undibacterium arcticum]